MIKTVILARETPISMKDLRAQLLNVEGNIESRVTNLSNSMIAMYVRVIHQVHRDLKENMSKERVPIHRGKLKEEMVLMKVQAMEEITTTEDILTTTKCFMEEKKLKVIF